MTLLKANRDLQRLGIKRSRIESPASGIFCSPLFLGMDLCFPCLKHRGKKPKSGWFCSPVLKKVPSNHKNIQRLIGIGVGP